MNSRIALFIFLMASIAHGQEIKKVSLPLIPDLQRADLYFIKPTDHPAAILVLSPGFNGNGRDWIESSVWQEFARKNNLALAGLSFASDGDQLRKGHGYYYPSQGSGRLLLEGLDRAFDSHLPLLLYGFSGGAHFTSGFAEWKPERVMAWCAYSAEWWDKPSPHAISPPGLVMCGNDDERLGASLLYFKQGRALGKPWLWISVPNNGHSISSSAEDFVRYYFASILDARKSSTTGQWVDIDLKKEAHQDMVQHQPSLTGWLPDSKLLAEWEAAHQP